MLFVNGFVFLVRIIEGFVKFWGFYYWKCWFEINVILWIIGLMVVFKDKLFWDKVRISGNWMFLFGDRWVWEWFVVSCNFS